MKYLLDTNICIGVLKGDKLLADKIQPLDDFTICSIVKAELLFGARNSKKIDENLKLLQLFFTKLYSFSFEDTAAEYYGSIRSMLTKSGKLIGANDLLIASIALAQDLTLISRNKKEFIRIPNLKFLEW